MSFTHEHQTKFKQFVLTCEEALSHKDALGPFVPTSLQPKLCEHPGCCKEPAMPCATCGVDLCAQHGGLMVDGNPCLNMCLNMCLQSRCHEHTDLDICPCEDCKTPDLADIRMWKDWIGFSGCLHVGHLEGPCVRDPGSHCVHCDAPLCFEHAAIDRDLKRAQSKCHMHSLTDVNCPCPGCRDPGLESFVAKVEVPPPVSHTPALSHTTPRKPKSKRLVNLQSIPENDSVMKIRSKFRPCRQGKASAEESC